MDEPRVAKSAHMVRSAARRGAEFGSNGTDWTTTPYTPILIYRLLDRQAVSNDVAPTSLNEGRGEVMVPALAVGLNLSLGLKYYLGAVVVVRGQAGSPNAERRGHSISGRGTKLGNNNAESRSSDHAEDKP